MMRMLLAKQKSVKSFGACALTIAALLMPAVAAADETGTKADPIKTASKLVERLTAANETYHGQTRSATLYVAPGKYDVSSSYMLSYTGKGVKEMTSTSHLAVAGYVLSGTTTNPRDVVIYCSHTSNPSNRLFSLSLGGLEYLTVSNACLNGYKGGGVWARGGTNDVCRHVVLTDCEATSDGGGSYDGSWYDCTYANNKVNDGYGGAANSGYYEDCTFTNNSATARGGAVYYGATLVDCKVVGNKATQDGGGIGGNGSVASACTMRGGEIAYNTSNANGGGSYCCSLFNVNVHHNTATNSEKSAKGGGVAGGTGEGFDEAVCTMRGGELAYNTAPSDGGGSYDYNLYDVVMHHNTSLCSGGGAQINGSQVVSGCIVTNNSGKWAGGVRGCDQSLVTKTLIACNTAAKQGGGVYFNGSGSRIVDCVISNNFANVPNSNGTAQGGGVFMGGSARMSDSRICYNRLWGSHTKQTVQGGGVYGGTVTNCVIDGNAVMYPGVKEYANNALGGGVAEAKLYDCKVYNNVLFGGRNGTGLSGGSAWKCVFSNNVSGTTTATYSIRTSGNLTDCDIHDGGIINSVLLNCRLMNCSNAVYLAKGANCATNGWFVYEPTMLNEVFATNCLFAGMCFPNSIFSYQGTKKGTSLVNCTIANNRFNCLMRVLNNGTNGVMLVENCLITGNTKDGVSETNLSSYKDNAKFVALVNNVIGPGRNEWATPKSEVNTYDLTKTAKFVGGEGADAYAIKYSSPARGWGVVRSWMTNALDIRQDARYPRLRDGKVDVGCYQCWLDPVGFVLVVQ